MEPRLVRACALWAALRICEHETPHYSVQAAVENAVFSLSRATTVSEHAMWATTLDMPSGIRSAIYCMNENLNFRLHAEHALLELARQQGLHFVEAMLNDLFETQTSPLEFAA